MNCYKVHTTQFGRLTDCIKKCMYGVTNKAITNEMPEELYSIAKGDIIFISEKEISNNALFGPFYVTDNRSGIIAINRKGCWLEIDANKSNKKELAYWVEFDNMNWCLLFDKTLSDKVSIVWPRDWRKLNLNLPSWGKIREQDVNKLIDFSIRNELEAKDFLRKHDAL